MLNNRIMALNLALTALLANLFLRNVDSLLKQSHLMFGDQAILLYSFVNRRVNVLEILHVDWHLLVLRN
jgi:hypothetical protein